MIDGLLPSPPAIFSKPGLAARVTELEMVGRRSCAAGPTLPPYRLGPSRNATEGVPYRSQTFTEVHLVKLDWSWEKVRSRKVALLWPW